MKKGLATTNETIDHLLRIDDESFQKVVNEEFRHTEDRPRVQPEIIDALRSPEVIHRWYLTLLTMQKSIEGQLAAKTADNDANIRDLRLKGAPYQKIAAEESSFSRWRAGTLRAKNGMEIRLLEARSILQRRGDPFVQGETSKDRNQALARVGVLEEAIRRHRSTMRDVEDYEPTVADEELWSYLPTEP